MITVRVVHVSIEKVSTLADYKQSTYFTDVTVTINVGVVTLSKLDEIKFLAFTAGVPQTATVTITDGVVTFKHRIPKKEPSNLPYPDGKQEYRRFVTEF